MIPGKNPGPSTRVYQWILAMRMIALFNDLTTIGHPRLCQALDNAAQEAGAALLRGVEDLKVTPDCRRP